ncbi:hypothetical protein [Bradyrhizobium sp. F1.13.3]|uniref:hypothetical protein n=1 Tax=Bradyrhizobium sp. F1.13.3 TaxID=3156351 RepID=UPI00339ADA91
MSESEMVAQLNGRWRVMLLSDGVTRRSRTWCVDQLVDGAWCTHTTLRSADMLRWLMQGEAIGPVDATAAAVLERLPPRVDVHVAVKAKPVAVLAARPPRVHSPAVAKAKQVAVAPAARAAPIAPIAPEVVRIPAKPDGIHDAAARERIAIERVRFDEERARAEERYWRGIIK